MSRCVRRVSWTPTQTHWDPRPASPVQNTTPQTPLGPPLSTIACVSRQMYLKTFDTLFSISFSAQPLVLECSASTTSGHVTIDCKTNRRVQKTLCSFNDGVQHLCMYLSITNNCVNYVCESHRFISSGHQSRCVSSWQPFSHHLSRG